MLLSIIFCSRSLFSYLQIWKCNLAASGVGIGRGLNYQQWRMTWHSFLRLLDVDYDGCFQCEECGPYPSVILCDATSLGYRKKFATAMYLQRDSDNSNDVLNGR